MIDPPTTDTLMRLAGRLHPVVLHLPIGLLAGLAVMELRGLVIKRDPEDRNASAAPTLLWLTIAAALLATGSGILLADEGAQPIGATNLHRNLALIMTGLLCVAGLVHSTGWRRGYLAMLSLGAIAMIPAGHFGASMTHGESFLWAPLTGQPAPVATAVVDDGKVRFVTDVRPTLEAHCIACHGADASKGRLRLDSVDAILAGGRAGASIVPGDPGASLMLGRMRLPPDHDEHMPPAGRSQPSALQIDLIEAWIADGAPDDRPFAVGAALAARVASERGQQPTPSDDPLMTEPDPAPIAAIRALVDAQLHVVPVAPGSTRLSVDTRPNAMSVDDAFVRARLTPIMPNIAELSLASTRITGSSLASLAAAPLTELDLSWTGIGDDALVHLDGCEQLQVLRLTGTAVTPAGLEVLDGMASLREVYLWRTAVTEADTAGLDPRTSYILSSEPSQAVAIEDPPTLSSGRPMPGETRSLSPVNQACPVTGSPVDPTYALVFEGRVVGFCCRHCAATFWEDPERYRDALPEE